MKKNWILLITIFFIGNSCDKIVDAVKGDLRTVHMIVEASSSSEVVTDFYYQDDKGLNESATQDLPWEKTFTAGVGDRVKLGGECEGVCGFQITILKKEGSGAGYDQKVCYTTETKNECNINFEIPEE